MKIYLVGGAVRDILLNETPSDLDYVVVNSTHEEMISSGFQKTGSTEAPIYTSKERGGEFSLARKEVRIDGKNPYNAFSFEVSNVSLEDDLKRRDLTINAVALDQENDEYIDPFNGMQDLRIRVLRHVSDSFKEDPTRVFRLARFCAKLPEFSVAPETISICKEMTKTSDFESLPVEMVSREMFKSFNTAKPSRFFEFLKEVGGLSFYFPEIKALIDVPQNEKYHPEGCAFTHTMIVLNEASKTTNEYKNEIMYSCLVHDLGKGITPENILPAHHNHEESGVPLVEKFSKRFGISKKLTNVAIVVTRNHIRVHRIHDSKATSIVRLLMKIGAYNNPSVVEILARSCEADDVGKLKNPESVTQGRFLEKCFEVTKKPLLDFNSLKTPELIKNKVREWRVNQIKELIKQSDISS